MNYTIDKPLIKIENVSLKYGDKLILRDINLEIKDIKRDNCITGQVITLLGRSGVGKTQFMRILSGLIKPTTGIILVGENQIPVEPGLVGMVMQNYPLFEHRTLYANLRLVSKDKSKIETYLNDFDLYQHKDKYPSQLSGGQRQRTAVIQQILCSAHFILCDEIFSGIDPVATEKMMGIIRKIADMNESNTVVISSHILEPSLAVSDSVYMLGYETTFRADAQDEFHPKDAFDKVQIPGATIRYFYDLAANGLAWNPEIRKDARFVQFVEDIRQIFQTL